MKKRISSVDLIKCIAVLLIINSHSDILYPKSIRFLASGGAIGNQIFFLISGYLFSIHGSWKQDFWNRFIKLYSPMYVIVLIELVIGRIYITSIWDFLFYFIWPSRFWFVSAILLFSIILRLSVACINVQNRYIWLTLFSAIIAIDIVAYIFFINKSTWIIEDGMIGVLPIHFKLIYGFATFLLGYFIRLFIVEYEVHNVQWKKMFLAVIMFICFYAFKFALNKGYVPMNLQIISQLLTVVSATTIFLAMIDIKIESLRTQKIFYFVASKSLYIYVVQFLSIELVAKIKVLCFPISILVCCVVIWGGAVALNCLTDVITRKLIIKHT